MTLKSLAFALALAGAALPIAAGAQAGPNWNVTLHAEPGTSTQRVKLSATTLTIDAVFAQNKIHEAVPVASIKSITAPYLYTNKNWLIDLKLSPKAPQTNALTVVNHTETTLVDEVSLQFKSEADAAAARTYLMAHLH